jgi:hypothetical protein
MRKLLQKSMSHKSKAKKLRFKSQFKILALVLMSMTKKTYLSHTLLQLIKRASKLIGRAMDSDLAFVRNLLMLFMVV